MGVKMKKKQFYIDVGKAVRLGVIGRVKVTINGKEVTNVIAAMNGKNGFVEHCDPLPLINYRKGELITHKKRGNVKITIIAAGECA